MSDWHPDYLSEAGPEALIVYGLATDADRVLAELRDDAPPGPLSERHALIEMTAPALRLSSRGWASIGTDQRLDLSGADDLMLLCRERIMHSVSHFAVSVRNYVSGYLDFCRAQVDAHKDALTPEGGDIYTNVDWIFSACLPMPHARILLPKAFEGDGPGFAEVDIAFWDGAKLIAVMLEDGGTPLKSQRRRRDYLFETFPAREIVTAGTGGAFAAADLPASMTEFWTGLDMPLGPWPPEINLPGEGEPT